jgi:serine/threonine protein phosphatase PrpC
MVVLEVCSGDTFLLCSDGLSGLVDDDEMRSVVNDNFLHRVPDLLVDMANERGGNDNITVVVAYAVDERELEHEMACAPTAATVS